VRSKLLTRARVIGMGAMVLCLGAAALRFYKPVLPTAKAADGMDWRYYGNDPANTRFQNIDQVTTANASTLTPAWIFHTGVHDPMASMETSPLVVEGTMYVTTGLDDVFALDAATGKQQWAYHPADMPPIDQLDLCCSRNNRGVAYGDDRLYLGRLDATLVAIDAERGQQLWKVAVDNYQNGYSITMAPQYIDGLVIVGVAGGEYLIRGHVDAYDAETGRLVWRFYTTEPTTWAGDSWKTGAAPVWQTPAFDKSLGMVYLSTGNTGPDINGTNRAGTNLYAVCMVALDIRSGKLRWYFQEVHHDIWDYDATPPVVLFTLNGTPAIAHAGKSGYMFILDRRNGKPLYQVNETPVPTTPAWQHPWPTQPESIIESLTPHSVASVPPGYIAAPQWTPPQETAYVMQPGSEGGLEWPPMAYSPRTHFVYHHARYVPQAFQTTQSNVTGGNYPGWGSTTDDVPGIGEYGIYGAVDTTTGKVAWKIKTPDPGDSGFAIAGDVAFFGENSGLFHAVNAATGAVLWTFDGTSVPGGGGSTAAPIAYMAHGTEFIANAFGGNPGEDTPLGDAVIAFSLPGSGSGHGHDH
jgi:quinohemoprotein ethanol dehydrogenase